MAGLPSFIRRGDREIDLGLVRVTIRQTFTGFSLKLFSNPVKVWPGRSTFEVASKIWELTSDPNSSISFYRPELLKQIYSRHHQADSKDRFIKEMSEIISSDIIDILTEKEGAYLSYKYYFQTTKVNLL